MIYNGKKIILLFYFNWKKIYINKIVIKIYWLERKMNVVFEKLE